MYDTLMELLSAVALVLIIIDRSIAIRDRNRRFLDYEGGKMELIQRVLEWLDRIEGGVMIYDRNLLSVAVIFR